MLVKLIFKNFVTSTCRGQRKTRTISKFHISKIAYKYWKFSNHETSKPCTWFNI